MHACFLIFLANIFRAKKSENFVSKLPLYCGIRIWHTMYARMPSQHSVTCTKRAEWGQVKGNPAPLWFGFTNKVNLRLLNSD